MKLTRRQLLVAGGGMAGALAANPLHAATLSTTTVEVIADARALALPGGEQLLITEFGRRVHWQRGAQGVQPALGNARTIRIVAAGRRAGLLWLLDRGRRRLLALDENGVLIRHLDLATLQEPADMVLLDNQAIIADVHGHQLVAVNLRNGAARRWRPSRPLNGPASLALTNKGLSALTLGDRQFHHYSFSGQPLGSEPATTDTPSAITAMGDRLLVLDRCRNQLSWTAPHSAAISLPPTGQAQLTHLSWQGGGNLLISL